jgi:hypothetical protein
MFSPGHVNDYVIEYQINHVRKDNERKDKQKKWIYYAQTSAERLYSTLPLELHAFVAYAFATIT